MSKSNAFENALLLLIFNNDTIAGIGDATGILGSAADGVLWVGLHTADPAEGGTQTSSEATYTGYARISIPRTTAGWTVSGSQVTNAALAQFGTCTAGSQTVTYFSVGSAQTGTGLLLYRGLLNNGGLAISANITPQFSASTLVVNED